MRKAVFIPWEDIPGILADYFTAPPEDVKICDGGVVVVTERKAQDETDRT